MDAARDLTAVRRPNFLTTKWGVVTTASAEGTPEVRAALDGIYRVYWYPVYAYIRRCGYGWQEAQDLTQDFFIYLLKNGILGQADPQRGRFRSFLLGTLRHFLAMAVNGPTFEKEAAIASSFLPGR